MHATRPGDGNEGEGAPDAAATSQSGILEPSYAGGGGVERYSIYADVWIEALLWELALYVQSELHIKTKRTANFGET
jgi:hypothetical protein